ncbi:unnamed protein product [Diplocarpon coronariae]
MMKFNDVCWPLARVTGTSHARRAFFQEALIHPTLLDETDSPEKISRQHQGSSAPTPTADRFHPTDSAGAKLHMDPPPRAVAHQRPRGLRDTEGKAAAIPGSNGVLAGPGPVRLGSARLDMVIWAREDGPTVPSKHCRATSPPTGTDPFAIEFAPPAGSRSTRRRLPRQRAQVPGPPVAKRKHPERLEQVRISAIQRDKRALQTSGNGSGYSVCMGLSAEEHLWSTVDPAPAAVPSHPGATGKSGLQFVAERREKLAGLLFMIRQNCFSRAAKVVLHPLLASLESVAPARSSSFLGSLISESIVDAAKHQMRFTVTPPSGQWGTDPGDLGPSRRRNTQGGDHHRRELRPIALALALALPLCASDPPPDRRPGTQCFVPDLQISITIPMSVAFSIEMYREHGREA